MSDRSFFDDGPTDPFRTLDPELRQVLHGELTGDELVAAVYADPDSDEPRLVYGDYLIEHDDPRGEFVQLQLARSSSTAAGDRERELFARHHEAWLGPLVDAVHPSTVEFRRGFLAACTAFDRSIQLRDVIGHPMWVTVDELVSDETALVAHPCMRSLRDVTTTPEALARLAGADHPVKLTAAGFGTTYQFSDADRASWRMTSEVQAWREVMAAGKLPELRTLRFGSPINLDLPQTEAMLASPLGCQLTTLELELPMGGPMAGYVDLVCSHPSIRRIGVHCGSSMRTPGESRLHSRIWIERTDASAHLRVVLELAYATGRDAVEALARLPAGYRRVELVLRDRHRSSPATDDDRRWVQAQLGRFEIVAG